MEKLSEFLISYRKSNALTQRDLAILLKTSTVTISNAERNKISVGPRVLKTIAIKCDLDLLEAVKLNENNK